MSVVRRSARRRWSIAVGGVAALCLAPVARSALPAHGGTADAGALRARILASASRPYEGYVESRGGLSLPDVPELGDVVGLLGGSARIRTWFASPSSWRVALVGLTGERDVYQTDHGVYLWDFERNLTLHVVGRVGVRPPWAADAVPPELARRLLSSATARDTVRAIAPRRVAGVSAVGLRVTSVDPETTVGRVDVWADPATGLPLQVEVAGRGQGSPAFVSRFMELRQGRPDARVLRPAEPASGRTVNTELATGLALQQVAPAELPETLGGQRRAGTLDAATPGVSVYGEGWARFVVLALRRRVASQVLRAALSAGGVRLELQNGDVVQLGNSLLSAIVVSSEGDRRSQRTYLVAGFVSAERLRQVGTDLLASAA